METQNKRKIIMIASLVFVALVLAGNVYSLIVTIINGSNSNIHTGYIIDISFAIIALLSAILYISAGFKKTSAKYFKFFLYTFILMRLNTLFGQVILLKDSFFSILPTLISFILLNVLFGTKDLGKKNSLILTAILFACSLYATIFWICTLSFNMTILFRWLADLPLSAVLLVMMLLKYYDKSLRNTK